MKVHFVHGCADCNGTDRNPRASLEGLQLRDWAVCSHCASLYMTVRRIGRLGNTGPLVSALALLPVPHIALRPRLAALSFDEKRALFEALQHVACLRQTPPAKRGQA